MQSAFAAARRSLLTLTGHFGLARRLLVMCCPASLYRYIATSLTFAAAAVAPAIALQASETVTVELQSGRKVTGETDAQTDHRLLWIRRENAGAQLASGYPWDQVRRVHSGCQVFTGRDFFPIAETTKSPGKKYAQITSAPPSPALERQAEASIDSHRVGDDLWHKAAARRVNTLYIEAYLTNWDGDPQADGLRVFVYPLAADGELVPVNGQIDLFLLGEIEKATGVIAPPQMPQFRELERRSHMVRPTDFARGAASYDLPFRQFHPDFYFDVARQALVNARLGVPGQGTFIASDANVQLRGYSRIRDELQMQTRQRFFRQENAVERDAAPPPLPMFRD